MKVDISTLPLIAEPFAFGRYPNLNIAVSLRRVKQLISKYQTDTTVTCLDLGLNQKWRGNFVV